MFVLCSDGNTDNKELKILSKKKKSNVKIKWMEERRCSMKSSGRQS